MQGTPLYLAAKLDLHDCARILLEHGASMVHPFEGETPLEVALRLKHEDVSELFFGSARSRKAPECLRRGRQEGRGISRAAISRLSLRENGAEILTQRYEAEAVRCLLSRFGRRKRARK